jgi:hypothetical protein
LSFTIFSSLKATPSAIPEGHSEISKSRRAQSDVVRSRSAAALDPPIPC